VCDHITFVFLKGAALSGLVSRLLKYFIQLLNRRDIYEVCLG